jgi:hypothetical protein
VTEDPHALIEQSKRLLRFHADAEKSRELLERLPQGHGSGLDADMVDGLHAAEIIGRAPGKGGGGGGSAGMQKHGNEFHTVEFAEAVDAVKSVPPDPAKKKVTNVYIEFVDGDPKVRVEYEE